MTGKRRSGAGVSQRLSLAQQTLLLSFKRSSFQSHLDSHLQTPPLLSINHPRLNGRFMQILILSTERADPSSLPQITRFLPREPLFPWLYFFPRFFTSLAFSTSSSTLGFFHCSPCVPFSLLFLLIYNTYVFLIKLWRVCDIFSIKSLKKFINFYI